MWEQVPISKRVLAVMALRGWIKKDLCDAMEIDPSMFSRFLRALDGPASGTRLSTLWKLVDALGVDIGWLLTGKGEPSIIETPKTGEAVAPPVIQNPADLRPTRAAIEEGVAGMLRSEAARKARRRKGA